MRQKSARERMDPIIAELAAQVPVSVTMAQARVVRRRLRGSTRQRCTVPVQHFLQQRRSSG